MPPHLRLGLALGKDHLGHAGAQRAMMIELGESEILERQMTQPLQRHADFRPAFAHFCEQQLNRLRIHAFPPLLPAA